ncbi:MAG: hexosaminidase, partial [Maribacter sp.]
MKNINRTGFIFLIIFILFSCTENKINEVKEINLIPLPQKMELKKDGTFLLSANTKIDADDIFKNEVNYLKKILPKTKASESNFIEIKKVEGLKKEEYKLDINTSKIEIKASFPAGAMRAIQTLRQILPPNYEKEKKTVRIPT